MAINELRTRLQAIADTHGVDMRHIALTVGLHDDDLSILLDPEYFERLTGYRVALPHGKYQVVEAEVMQVLQQV